MTEVDFWKTVFKDLELLCLHSNLRGCNIELLIAEKICNRYEPPTKK